MMHSESMQRYCIPNFLVIRTASLKVSGSSGRAIFRYLDWIVAVVVVNVSLRSQQRPSVTYRAMRPLLSTEKGIFIGDINDTF